MAIGVIIGARWFPVKYQKHNSIFQTLCTCVLIFAMGVSLGNRPEFMQELQTLGVRSLIFAIVPIIFSILFVFLLSRTFLEKKK